MTYDQSLIRHRKRYRKENNLDPVPATVYGYDTTLPGYVLVQFVRSNGRLSGPVPVRPPTRYMNLKPGAAVMLEYYKGQLRIAETDNETEVARGNNPLAAILQVQSSKITQMDIATLNVTADGSLSLTIAAWNPIVNGTAYQFPGARLDMTSSKPSSGQMCYALLAVKSDYATTEIKTSTPRTVTDVPLALADVQECITALTAGSTATFAVKLTGDLTGITPEYFKQNSVDCRQLVNTGGGGGDLTATYLLKTADALLPNAQVMGALATGLVKNTTTTGAQSIAAAADVLTALSNQNANTVVAGPTSGGAGAVTARALVAADIPGGGGGTFMPGGRLTLTTGVPLTTADVTAATTLYYTPYLHDKIMLYNGSSWDVITFTELSIAVPATTSTMYDVFCYNNSGTPTLELLAWTNDTTRATALAYQDGRLVKSGAATRLYLGSMRTTTVSGQTEDSAAMRFVWNRYNREFRTLYLNDASAHTYNSGTVRMWNNTAGDVVKFIVGLAVEVDVAITGAMHTAGAGDNAYIGVGVDSTTATDTECGFALNSNTSYIFSTGFGYKNMAEGYHYLSALEAGGIGTNSAFSQMQLKAKVWG